jgi:hypothetical protein
MADNMRTRKVVSILIIVLPALAAGAGEVEFSLNLDAFRWTPHQDARTKARLAEWNDPMGRMMYQFNQQQAWIMRGTMPGGERDSGVTVRVKAQNGLPLHLIASTIQSGLDIAQQDVARFGPRQASEEELDAMTLEEQLTELLGRRLVPQ